MQLFGTPATNGSLSLTVRFFGVGGGLVAVTGGYVRCYARAAQGPFDKSLKKFREFSEQNRDHQKIFAAYFTIKVKVR
jgi:hypothetical protein